MELEGEEGFKYIEEYADSSTKRGKDLREAIAKKFNFASLEFQSLDGIVEAIGIDKCKLCTYSSIVLCTSYSLQQLFVAVWLLAVFVLDNCFYQRKHGVIIKQV